MNFHAYKKDTAAAVSSGASPQLAPVPVYSYATIISHPQVKKRTIFAVKIPVEMP